jgi:hypothetical protein
MLFSILLSFSSNEKRGIGFSTVLKSSFHNLNSNGIKMKLNIRLFTLTELNYKTFQAVRSVGSAYYAVLKSYSPNLF